MSLQKFFILLITLSLNTSLFGQDKKVADLMKRAKSGDAAAQFYLGVRYTDGQGVPQDYAEAVKWFRKAADQGLGQAQVNLGVMYAVGRGVPQDDVIAYKWLNIGAAQGHENAKKVKSIIAERMTREQIAEAQKLSREWKPKANP